MRLEVLVDQQEPLIFPLNKEKILIGSGESCDILLDAEGISRKHVILHCGEDEFYVIDQGSTNGTFINEERLVPGKRVEFTSFFPVRLGANVLLTLLSDEESQDFELASFNLKTPAEEEKESPKESTRVFNSSDLREHTNLGINLHRKKVSVKSKSSKKELSEKVKKKKEDTQFQIVVAIAVVVIIGAILFQLSSSEEEFYDNYETQVTQTPAVSTPQAAPSPPPVVIPKVAAEHIRSPEEVAQIQIDFKCVSNVEKEICQRVNLNPPYGATQVGLDVFIFTSVEYDEEFLLKMKELFPHSEGEFSAEIAMAYFFSNYDLSLTDEFKDYRLHLYFLDKEDKPFSSLSFYPEAYKKFKEKAPEHFVDDAIQRGKTAFEFSKEFFVFHQ
ncbi:MAG TPA: FHA domain-containing protein [Bacteriovoracaceae bacterium]|nr:FHA domain-containing protein [Bacteriovoracaceae bacterium]